MIWWQILLVFGGIPAAMFLLITVSVLKFTTARMPDGLRHAEAEQEENDPAAKEHDGASEDEAVDDSA